MKKNYRVFAKNIIGASGTGIQEIGTMTVVEAIRQLVDHALEAEVIPIDGDDDNAYIEAIDKACDKAEAAFYDENRELHCGDFYIVRSEEAPTERPNCCRWSTEIF